MSVDVGTLAHKLGISKKRNLTFKLWFLGESLVAGARVCLKRLSRFLYTILSGCKFICNHLQASRFCLCSPSCQGRSWGVALTVALAGKRLIMRAKPWFCRVLSPTLSKYLKSICATKLHSSGLTIAISRIFETKSILEAANKATP